MYTAAIDKKLAAVSGTMQLSWLGVTAPPSALETVEDIRSSFKVITVLPAFIGDSITLGVGFYVFINVK